MNAKEEADKIITEILKITGSNCEHDFYCADSECNLIKGRIVCKVDYETARKLAMLQVKNMLENILLFPFLTKNHIAYKKYKAILTELERTK